MVNVAKSFSATLPRREDGTVSPPTSSGVRRKPSVARTYTSYCSPPSL
jgi:hypothetical protein